MLRSTCSRASSRRSWPSLAGRERLIVVLRYPVLARPELDVRAVADEFRRVAGEEAGEVVMSTAQELIEQGRVVERRELLEMQLREKFKKLDRSVRERLEAASAEDLHLWARQVVNAKHVEDVFAPRKRRAHGRSSVEGGGGPDCAHVPIALLLSTCGDCAALDGPPSCPGHTLGCRVMHVSTKQSKQSRRQRA